MMSAGTRVLARLGWLLLTAALLGACQTTRNPTTSDAVVDTGRPAANQLLSRYGGEYRDPAVQAYVESVGRRVLAASPVDPARVHFVLLDTDVANAFVVSGGTI